MSKAMAGSVRVDVIKISEVQPAIQHQQPFTAG